MNATPPPIAAPSDPELRRLFVALELPTPIRGQLHALKKNFPGLRWTPIENIHLTIKFIGEVPDEIAGLIRQSLYDIRVGSFTARINGLGCFARKWQTVLWAGLEPCPALLDLKQRVDEVLANQTALPPDLGRYTPHITLARLKTPPPNLKQTMTACSRQSQAEFAVKSFTLFHSRLTTTGAMHTVEQLYPLQLV